MLTRGGILPSNGCIGRLFDIRFDAKHPILTYDRQKKVRLLAQNVYLDHFHHKSDRMRSVINLKHAIFGLRRLLKSTENHCVTCRKRRIITVKPFLDDRSVNFLCFKQMPSALTSLEYFDHITFPIEGALSKGVFFYLTHSQGCTPRG